MRQITRSLTFMAIALVLVLTGCYRRPLEVYYHNVARVRVNVDWETYFGEKPSGMTMLLYKDGDQADFGSAGVTFGHSWTISRHWNLEASVSAGVVLGERRHYNGEFGDTHLIWKYNKTLFYAGPTKAKISLVWMIGKKTKEGSR